MRYVFPAVFRKQTDVAGYHIFFPDIQGAGTVGEDLYDGIDMAQDWLCGRLFEMEENGEIVPRPSDTNEIKYEKDDIVTLIATDTDNYRHFL
ncbi:MAG: type II toxin-antitoxin system HicB family antitoxin [Defluviitaleaceae bacterium]|nr:type II toxin-antitoxin system HicB family antitoxin [Defluviitaleaceae bacterium]